MWHIPAMRKKFKSHSGNEACIASLGGVCGILKICIGIRKTAPIPPKQTCQFYTGTRISSLSDDSRENTFQFNRLYMTPRRGYAVSFAQAVAPFPIRLIDLCSQLHMLLLSLHYCANMLPYLADFSTIQLPFCHCRFALPFTQIA